MHLISKYVVNVLLITENQQKINESLKLIMR